MQNLDYLCIRTAQEMVGFDGPRDEMFTPANSSLAVLVEHGPYAMVLFLYKQAGDATTSGKKNKKQVAGRYIKALLKLLQNEPLKDIFTVEDKIPAPGSGLKEVSQWLKVLAQDLDKYLLLKKVWQRTLVYARYHAQILPRKGDTPKKPTAPKVRSK